nr:hypothetical protein [Tanacetum cinerariifolium]
QALDLAVDELCPRQLTLDTLTLPDGQAARQAVDAAFRQGFQLSQARRQAIGVDAHGVKTSQAAARLWPLRGDLLAQGIGGIQQPRGFAEAYARQVVVHR